ncbi:MAG: hypothetical protein HY900_10310 [Deltaproteobacteria bacterium]|nr:hypothetical protein [Deltaproteobacteria bacterium]
MSRAKAGAETVLVTSPGRREGKTFTAVGLAASLADRTGLPTVLVDANPHDAAVLAHFGVESSPGLSDYLERRATLPDVLLEVEASTLRVLPAGMRSGPELRAHFSVRDAVARLREIFPGCFIIVDGPSVLAGPEALELCELADSILLVVRGESTREAELVSSLRLLGPAPVVGLVYNEGPRSSRAG